MITAKFYDRDGTPTGTPEFWPVYDQIRGQVKHCVRVPVEVEIPMDAVRFIGETNVKMLLKVGVEKMVELLNAAVHPLANRENTTHRLPNVEEGANENDGA